MKNVKAGHTKPVVCLDAGHYGKYNRSPAVPEYYESDMNWKLHLMLKEELESYGIEVITTRADKDKDLALVDRGNASKDCDLFISIHSNAAGSKTNDNVDYPLAIVQLDGKGNALGEKLADTVKQTMGCKQNANVWTRRGTYGGEYYGVLWGSANVGTMGMILEHSFHTCTKMAKWLSDDANLAKLAEAEAKVVAEWFGMTEAKTTEPEHWYRIRKSWADAKSQTAAYKSKENAIKACHIGYSVFDWNGKEVYTHTPQAAEFTVTLPVLRNGDKGGWVKALQQLLMANGIDLPNYGADGSFGGETESAVIEYQKREGLSATGSAGAETVGSLLGII